LSGEVPFPTLWWSIPQVSHCYKSSPLQVRWGEAPNLPSLQACLFTVLVGKCPRPLSPELKVPCPLCPFQLLVYYSGFFCGAGVSLSRGLYCFIPGVAVGVLSAAYLLTC
jgi:hypothetical protein